MNNKMKSYGDLLMEYYNGNKQVIQKIKRDDGKLIEVPVIFYFRIEKNLLVTEKDFILKDLWNVFQMIGIMVIIM